MKRKTTPLADFRHITSDMEIRPALKGFALVADLYPVVIFQSESYSTVEKLKAAMAKVKLQGTVKDKS